MYLTNTTEEISELFVPPLIGSGEPRDSYHVCVHTDLQGAGVSIIHLTVWKRNVLLPDSNHVCVLTDLQGVGVSIIYLTGWKQNILLPYGHFVYAQRSRGYRDHTLSGIHCIEAQDGSETFYFLNTRLYRRWTISTATKKTRPLSKTCY